MKKLFLVLGLSCVGCGSETTVTVAPPRQHEPVTLLVPPTSIDEPVSSLPTHGEPVLPRVSLPSPVDSTPAVLTPNAPDTLVVAHQDVPFVWPANVTNVAHPIVLPIYINNTISPAAQPIFAKVEEENIVKPVPAPQIPLIQLAADEVQLELQDCVDFSHVDVTSGQLIVASNTPEEEAICFLINVQLIPGLKDRTLKINDTIQIGDFEFVIVARG